MLREWWQSVRTPASPRARALGYVHEAVAIVARAGRCHRAWAPHLQRCRSEILSEARRLGPRRTLVLGSGAWLDVPVAELRALGFELDLVDIVHPRQAIHAAAADPGIRLRTADATGAVLSDTPVEDVRDRGFATLDGLIRETDAQWVISANLVSQLPLARTHELAKSGTPHDAIVEYGAALIATHLEWLRAAPVPTLALGDIERHHYNRHGQLTLRSDPLWGQPAPEPRQAEWTWRLAPAGELEDGEVVETRVGAWVGGGG